MIYYLAFDFHKSISSDHFVIQKEIYYIKMCKYLWYIKNIVKKHCQVVNILILDFNILYKKYEYKFIGIIEVGC